LIRSLAAERRKAAMNLKRNFFLTEKEQKYIQRIKEELGSQNILFDYLTHRNF
jgi:DNA modification methylase